MLAERRRCPYSEHVEKNIDIMNKLTTYCSTELDNAYHCYIFVGFKDQVEIGPVQDPNTRPLGELYSCVFATAPLPLNVVHILPPGALLCMQLTQPLSFYLLCIAR